MSDLISREALIKAMEKKYDIVEATGMYPTGLSEAFIITEKIIREQPTAYSVDKVVEQLEEKQQLYIGYKNEIDTNEMSRDEQDRLYLYDGYDYGYLDAIDIVRGGWKE